MVHVFGILKRLCLTQGHSQFLLFSYGIFILTFTLLIFWFYDLFWIIVYGMR